MKYKFAFTLAETMIVLVVIGVLSAILLPVAQKSTANEKVLKAKRAYSTIGKVVSELVASDKYYLDGDLGRRPNGVYIDGTHEGDFTYFCETFASLLSSKEVQCIKSGQDWAYYAGAFSIQEAPNSGDSVCTSVQNNYGVQHVSHIIANDDVIFFELNPMAPFGLLYADSKVVYDGSGVRLMYEKDSQGLYNRYKSFCIDVDGWRKGEDPFNIMIQVDGRIQPSIRMREWLEKSVQDKD
ncbi:MAG: prepilin-type N-terminal cleavage/methylation domain-containing protein [Candidatus Gastranaerophilales bacterium]|nr:prepilin-type N-terminal cleavage/methylation domain-containing protein [Candidatus Gastranaerophilales bacterium]